MAIPRACRTCHISYEPAPAGEPAFADTRRELDFGRHEEFISSKVFPITRAAACGSIRHPKPMPNAEQTLNIFWSTSARAHLFAQVPEAFGDCAPPPGPAEETPSP
jgi:hypothetical protein